MTPGSAERNPSIVIFSTADLRVGSGTEIRSRLLARCLRALGAEVGVLAAGVPEEFASLGIDDGSRHTSRGGSLRVALEAFCRERRADIIYGITEGLADDVLHVARVLGCACAFDIHGIGVVEILELGGGHGNRVTRIRNSLRWLRAMSRADAITVANPTLLAPVRRLISRRATLVAGAVDLEHFSPAGPVIRPAPADQVHVLYAGNFLRWQGCELLLDAALLLRDSPEFHFTFVGSFARSARQMRKAQPLVDAGHLRFIDSVPYDDVPAYLRGGDVLVIPRPWMFSTYLAFPNKLTDYMASGRAVVATDIAPHRFAIESGRTGLLCPPTPRGIADALLTLRDPKLRERLGANARVAAEERFSAERAASSVYAVLTQAIARRRGPVRRPADGAARVTA